MSQPLNHLASQVALKIKRETSNQARTLKILQPLELHAVQNARVPNSNSFRRHVNVSLKLSHSWRTLHRTMRGVRQLCGQRHVVGQ